MCSTNEEQPGNLKYHIDDKGARQTSFIVVSHVLLKSTRPLLSTLVENIIF